MLACSAPERRSGALLARLERRMEFVMQAAQVDGATQTEIRSAITTEVTQLAVARFGSRLKALILTGSLARNEGTFAARNGQTVVLGDAEFVAIFESRVPLPSSLEIADFCSRAGASLAGHGVRVEISMSAARPQYLQRLGPEIFAYELRVCGLPVLGDPNIPALIPPFTPAEISREDAWRLLCNRMVELVEDAAQLPGRPRTLSVGFSYRVLKLCLDMATSYLVFEGAYAPSYRERQRNLSRIAGSDAASRSCPVALEQFAQMVQSCTEWKLNGDCPEVDWGFFEQTVKFAHELWRWELSILAETGPIESVPDDVLLERWMRRQTLARRLRGWLLVLRCCEWRRTWRSWPRWIAMARCASPRYWTYAAASDLFFQLPALVGTQGADTPSDGRFRAQLPVRGAAIRRASAVEGWRARAGDIAWNYHALLENTRA